MNGWRNTLFAALLLGTSAWAEVEKGLVAHWDFNEGKGDVLCDRSGNENHGTIHGATWARIKNRGCKGQSGVARCLSISAHRPRQEPDRPMRDPL